ncbi:MAG TPA: c-type cytochrome domain-containing protein [Pirellulales bacterium]|nr:c-type cytochrome domain-containing protein [Pirellulales bacterium]
MKSALAVLRDNCYRCHGKEGTSEGGFNFVLDLEKVARTHVKPESPRESLLLQRLTASDDTIMPPPDEEPRPSAADIATIKSWIEEGAPALATQDGRVFLAKEKIVKSVLDDLNRANTRNRRFLRYFTLAHLYNAGVSNDELQSYRNAFVKLINSLSWNSELLTPETIDAARVVWRVDIRRLNWSSKEWDEIEQAYDYALEATTPDEIACCEATESKSPLVRVDWFVHAASQPPLYHTLLGIPGTDQELEALLRVNAEANIEQEQVMRAAFNRSGVSQNNRLIERHKSPYGSYWKSYDFGGNVGRQNLFEHPLGPGGDSEYFQHDGGELIFSLPNGLQGYMLVDARGRRLDKGPIEIVSDPKRPDKSVTNGVSCMSCHYTGVIAKADEIRNVVSANRKAFENADDILALYRDPRELDAALNEDAKRFAAAMTKIGINVLSRSGEPVSAMAAAFEHEIDLKLAACEFGLPPAEFEQRLAASENLARSLGTLRVGGGMKRDHFGAIFREAASDLGLAGDAPTGSASSSPSVRPRARNDDKGGEARLFSDPGWPTSSLAFSPKGNLLAVGKSDGALTLLDIQDGTRADIADKQRGLRHIAACTFTPDGSRLLAAGGTGKIVIWEVSKDRKFKEAGQFGGHSQQVECLAVSGDSRVAVSGGHERKVCLWQIDNGQQLGVFTGFQGPVKACAFASNGRTAWATDGAVLMEIDVKKRAVAKQTSLGPLSSAKCATLSLDGGLVAVGDAFAMRVWQTQSGKELAKLQDHEFQLSAAFTADGTRLVTGGVGRINVWDVAAQKKISLLETATHSFIQLLAASRDNQHVAVSMGFGGKELQILRIPREGNASLEAPVRFAPRDLFGRENSHIGEDTAFVGGPGGGATRLVDETSLLYGLECSFAKWMGQPCVQQIVPVFAREKGEKSPTRAVARDGYAVGAAKVFAGQYVHGIQLVFMRVRANGKLNPSDSYTSDVIGSRGRREPRTITGDGAPIIGVSFRHGLVVDAVALVVDGNKGR